VTVKPSVYDTQPTGNGVLIFISGNLFIDGDETKPIPFVRVFNLCQYNNSYYGIHLIY